MIQHAYRQIWRPAPSYNYCAADNFAEHYFDICDGYGRCENALRRVLAHGGQPKGLYTKLKQVTFELQDSYMHILHANGKTPSRRPTAQDFSQLEKAMRLSEYEVRLGDTPAWRPFAQLAAQPPALGQWYLQKAGVLWSPPALRRLATVKNLVAATAALRCLVWAQFGSWGDDAFRGQPGKRWAGNSLMAESIFILTPPAWPDEECYGHLPLHKNKVPCKAFPF